MSNWIVLGLRRGVLTTKYPHGRADMPERYRGRVVAKEDASRDDLVRGAAACLSGAVSLEERAPGVRMPRCFQCGQCRRVAPEAFSVTDDYELALVDEDVHVARQRLRRRAASFGRSIHVRHVDAGSDGSCEQELVALFNPFYDLNRLGIFLTPTPRHADLLVVTGVVTTAMAEPLKRTYEAMPEPKTIVAVGTAACSGSIFAGSPAVVGAVDRVIPVDVKIPGAPPAPLTILNGLWVALGRDVARAREGRS
jgi:Ni,Fe-hydrogenase III small subunit